MKAKVSFLGGVAGNLTGSCTLLIINEGKKTFKILIDAGLIQCGFKDSIKNNQEILKKINPSQVDYIVLTHSHIDHVGRVPLFIKNGFNGQIICTKGTKNLLKPMLEDSAKIQIIEAAYFNKKMLKTDEKNVVKKKSAKKNRDKNDRKKYKEDVYFQNTYSRTNLQTSLVNRKRYVEPLYNQKDVEGLYKFINNGYDYHRWIKLSNFISVKFYHSGHVMGGAIVVLRLSTKSKGISKPKDTYLCFSGDLGRRDGIILPPPEIINEPVDYLFLESTYGDRVHPERDQEISKLLELIKESSENKKRIIIPSFALERSQEIVYLLSYYMEQGTIPAIPIYLDSPLGSKITTTFAEAWYSKMFSDQDRVNFNPFDQKSNPYFKIITEQRQSDDLIASSDSYIVIAGSGMCDAGRVRGHLRANLGKPNTVVCLVGYMAQNSLGRNLKDGLPIKMNGEEIQVRAKIVNFDSFSAHADAPFLVDYTKAVLAKDKKNSKTIFLVHGEVAAAKDLQKDLEATLSDLVITKIPELHEDVIIR